MTLAHTIAQPLGKLILHLLSRKFHLTIGAEATSDEVIPYYNCKDGNGCDEDCDWEQNIDYRDQDLVLTKSAQSGEKIRRFINLEACSTHHTNG